MSNKCDLCEQKDRNAKRFFRYGKVVGPLKSDGYFILRVKHNYDYEEVLSYQ